MPRFLARQLAVGAGAFAPDDCVEEVDLGGESRSTTRGTRDATRAGGSHGPCRTTRIAHSILSIMIHGKPGVDSEAMANADLPAWRSNRQTTPSWDVGRLPSTLESVSQGKIEFSLDILTISGVEASIVGEQSKREGRQPHARSPPGWLLPDRSMSQVSARMDVNNPKE